MATREIRQTKTGLNIKEMIDIVLDELGCANHKNLFVIDSARNMITACDDKEIYSCSGHNLSINFKKIQYLLKLDKAHGVNKLSQSTQII